MNEEKYVKGTVQHISCLLSPSSSIKMKVSSTRHDALFRSVILKNDDNSTVSVDDRAGAHLQFIIYSCDVKDE
jgi:hypothetical protein